MSSIPAEPSDTITEAHDADALRRSPYPGLRPFRRDEAEWFFGREEQIKELRRKLDQHHFTAVVGPSGCGKSSLVRAGLFGELDSSRLLGADVSWQMTTLRPEARPLARLARALVTSGVLTPKPSHETELEYETGLLFATMRRGPRGLLEALALKPLPPNTNLVILVDQFEEIFRSALEANPDEARAFVALLLETAERANQQPEEFPVYLIITMRSDYLGQCDQFPGLPEAINESQFLTPRMTRDQRRAAIAGPAAMGGGGVDPALVNRLLNDMGDRPDHLPIMQHALMRMWHRKLHATGGADEEPPERIVLTVQDYDSAGGWSKTLSNHADEAFEALRDANRQRVAEMLFRSLTEPGPDGQGARRRVRVDKVARIAGVEVDDVKAVAEQFRRPDRSFLMPPVWEPLDAGTELDISHEALIRRWGRLRQWVKEETESARVYQRLEERALLAREGREAHLAPPGLDVALEWRRTEKPEPEWAERYGSEFEVAMEYLDQSEQKHLRQLREEKEQQIALVRERTRADEKAKTVTRIRRFTYALGILAVVALVAAGLALYQSLRAAEYAERNRALLHIREGTREAEAGRIGNGIGWYLLAAETAGEDSDERRSARRLAGGWGAFVDYQFYRSEDVPAAAFSRDGQVLRIFGIGKDGEAEVVTVSSPAIPWNSDTGIRRVRLKHDGPVDKAFFGFSEEHCWVVTVDTEGIARIWDAKSGELEKRLQDETLQDETRVHAIVFGPEGDCVFTGSDDGAVRMWKVSGTSPPREFEISKLESRQEPTVKDEVWVTSLAVSPDGKILAAAGSDGAVRMWDVASGKRRGEAIHHGEYVDIVKFVNVTSESPSVPKLMLLLSGSDNTVRRWDVTEGKPFGKPLAHEGQVIVVSHGDDGKVILTGSADGRARIWDTETGRPLTAPLVHDYAVSAVAMSPDEKLILTASRGLARLWSFSARGPKARSPTGERQLAMAIDPAKERIVAVDMSGHITTWHMPPKELPKVITIEDFSPAVAAIAPGGDYVIMADYKNEVSVWNVSSQERVAEPFKVDEPVTAVALNADATKAVAGGGSGSVYLWDMRTGTREELYAQGESPAHESEVSALAFSLDGGRFASASFDGTARLWDAETGDPIGERLIHDDVVRALAFDPAGKTLATGSNKLARLWDAQSGERLGLSVNETAAIVFLAFSGDGKQLVTGCSDHFSIWDVCSLARVGQPLYHPDTTAGAVYDVRTVAVGTGEGIWLWELARPMPAEPEKFPQWRAERMSDEQWRRVLEGNEKLRNRSKTAGAASGGD